MCDMEGGGGMGGPGGVSIIIIAPGKKMGGPMMPPGHTLGDGHEMDQHADLAPAPADMAPDEGDLAPEKDMTPPKRAFGGVRNMKTKRETIKPRGL